MMRFYKTRNPKFLAALDKRNAERRALFVKAKAFADVFGGIAIIADRQTKTTVEACILFADDHPNRTSPLWTKPVPGKNKPQRLRKYLDSGYTTVQIEEWMRLKALWETHFPRQAVTFESVLNLVGLKCSDLPRTHFGFFRLENEVYVDTTITIPFMSAISCEVYEHARQQMKRSEKQVDQEKQAA